MFEVLTFEIQNSQMISKEETIEIKVVHLKS